MQRENDRNREMHAQRFSGWIRKARTHAETQMRTKASGLPPAAVPQQWFFCENHVFREQNFDPHKRL